MYMTVRLLLTQAEPGELQQGNAQANAQAGCFEDSPEWELAGPFMNKLET